jgi:branched-chain amino acid transport system substrate-binding protein
MNRLKIWLTAALAVLSIALVGSLHAQQPLKIGFGMSLTGPLAGNGKAALISMQIWAEDVNARGGLLGRKVELVYYDDQTNPSTVPSIYNKLLDVDKVDLVVSGYGTNVIAPAMPIMMQRNMTFMSLFGLNVNSKFNYDRYFQIMTGAGARLDGGLLHHRDGPQSQAPDRGAGRRRRRISGAGPGRRARPGQEGGAQGGL